MRWDKNGEWEDCGVGETGKKEKARQDKRRKEEETGEERPWCCDESI